MLSTTWYFFLPSPPVEYMRQYVSPSSQRCAFFFDSGFFATRNFMFTPITIQKVQEGLFSGNTHLTLLPRLVSTYSSGRGWDEIRAVPHTLHSLQDYTPVSVPSARSCTPLRVTLVGLAWEGSPVASQYSYGGVSSGTTCIQPISTHSCPLCSYCPSGLAALDRSPKEKPAIRSVVLALGGSSSKAIDRSKTRLLHDKTTQETAGLSICHSPDCHTRRAYCQN